MPRRVLLTGVAAAGLAAVIDSAGPVQPSARRCAEPGAPRPVRAGDHLHLSRRPDPVRGRGVDGLPAGPGRRRRPGRQLPFQIAADLFYYTSITTLTDGSAPAPDLIGLSARAAVGRARGDHYSVGIDGAVIDAAAAAGAVVFQSLPAGARDSGPGGSVTVLLAARPAARCTASQLALTYSPAARARGTTSARSSSATSPPGRAHWPGRCGSRAWTAGGQPDTTTRVDQVQGSAVLTPDAGPIRWRPPGVLAGTRPGELTGSVQLISEYRDGPADVDRGLCEPLWVVPASWRVTLPGGILTVRTLPPRTRPGWSPRAAS